MNYASKVDRFDFLLLLGGLPRLPFSSSSRAIELGLAYLT